MRILELCGFSSGIDGVWQRVRQESELLSEKGHEVRVFSSNLIKGSNNIAKQEEQIGKIRVLRFPAMKLGGESYMAWNFKSAALEYKPDVIIAHGYRHWHTGKALKIARKLNCKAFLVTHAPFVPENETRSFFAKIAVRFYDYFIGPYSLRKFDKVIAITKWEIPYLLELGVKKNKIEYIPNGIPLKFFKQKKAKEENKILFLGRVAQIKNIEVLIKAFSLIKDKKIKLEIVGPGEDSYVKYLKGLSSRLGLGNRIIWTGAINDAKEKIKKIDSAKLFVLPSKREAMPQALIEAMAREKIAIASDNPGSRDLIIDGKNGFLFRNGDAKDLAEKIDHTLNNYKKLGKIRKNARKSVEQFSWSKVMGQIEQAIH